MTALHSHRRAALAAARRTVNRDREQYRAGYRKALVFLRDLAAINGNVVGAADACVAEIDADRKAVR